jgi:hypothetical protein
MMKCRWNAPLPEGHPAEDRIFHNKNFYDFVGFELRTVDQILPVHCAIGGWFEALRQKTWASF